MGVIVRTAGEGRTKRELQRDLAYLQRLYAAIQKRIKTTKGPALLYQESDLVTRVIRDFFTPDTDGDSHRQRGDAEEGRRVHAGSHAAVHQPRELYKGDAPLFHAYGVEKHIESHLLAARRAARRRAYRDRPGRGARRDRRQLRLISATSATRRRTRSSSTCSRPKKLRGNYGCATSAA